MTVLNLNPSTVQIIANFANINPSMMFQPGSNLKTVSPNQDIFAAATVTEDFPQQFAIYDLSKFLGVLSTYESPKIRFNNGKKYLTIHTETNNELYNYGFADPSMIIAPPDDDLEMPDTIAEFELPAKALASLNKRVSISKHPEVAIVSDGEDLSVQAFDVKKVIPDNYNHVLGKCDKKFRVVFKVEKLQVLMNMDYKVTVTEGIVRFHGNNINYWIAPEESSTYG